MGIAPIGVFICGVDRFGGALASQTADHRAHRRADGTARGTDARADRVGAGRFGDGVQFRSRVGSW